MATKKLVPRATNEGGLGTALKVWGGSWLQNLVITNLQASTSVSGLVENAGNVEKRNLTTIGIDVQDTNDSTSYVGLWESATGVLLPKTDEELRYDAANDALKIGSSGTDLWIKSGSITQYIKDLKVKVKGGIDIISSYGKVRIFGGIKPLISFYDSYGTWVHLLQTEPSPVNIITEAVPGGATNVNAGVNGILCRTPIANLVPNLQSLDEGSSLTATTQSINYVGAGVTTTVGSSNDTTVTIPGYPSVLDTNHNDCYVGLWEAATGALDPKTDTGLRYDATVGLLNVYTPGGGGTLRMGEVGNNASRRIDAGWNTDGNYGATFEIVGNSVLPGSATNKSGGPIYLVAGAGTGSASASGGDSSIVLMGHKDTVSGTTAQTATIMAMHSIGSANNMKMPSIQSSANDSFNVKVEAAKATLHTVNSSGSGPYNFPIHIEPRGDLILSTMDGGAGAKETYFKKNTTVQATVSSLRIESFMMACSDETTALTAGTNKVKFRMPYAFTVTEVRASLSTAGTGAQLVTVDINESGTSILSTKITIDATETTSVTAATAPVIADTSLADDAEMTVDIDFIDTGGVSKGLKVSIIGHKTV
jgi:hypothetical protein